MKIMHNGLKRIVVLCVAMLAICGNASAQDWRNLLKGAITDLADELTDGAASEVMLTGTWNYSSPALRLSGGNALADVAASAVLEKYEDKIIPVYNIVGVKKGVCKFTFNADNTFSAVIGKRTLTGTYTYDTSTHAISLNFDSMLLKLGSMNGYAYVEGDTMSMVFDCSKVITFFNKLGAQISSLKTLSALASSYDSLMIGYEFTR